MSSAITHYLQPLTTQPVSARMQAFENAQVLPEQKGSRDGNELYQLTLMLKEKPVRTYDSELEWALGQVHRKLPLPFPSHVVPGGYMMYEDRDLRGKGDSINASVRHPHLPATCLSSAALRSRASLRQCRSPGSLRGA